MSAYTRGIDLKYRPNSYFWAREHHITLLSDIKGAERRKIYESALLSGDAHLIDPALVEHALTAEDRAMQGRIHPNFMGGEYLPNQSAGEVEIARITIASTTQDVTSIYARQVGGRIHYRVVDEYEGDTLDSTSKRTSLKPLTLNQLVDFFISSWDLIGCLEANFGDHGYPREKIHRFVVDASSSFYVDFEELIHLRIDAWLNTVTRISDEDE